MIGKIGIKDYHKRIMWASKLNSLQLNKKEDDFL